ncbi:MAG: M6 family metalloprotease domain-containing protein [Armatimonadota bacterium]
MNRSPLYGALRPAAALTVALCLAGAAFAADDFRTVATAVTAQIQEPAASTATPGGAGYLGVHAVLNPKGHLVLDEVEADSPAARAGLQPGDHLLKLNGQTVKEPEALRSRLQSQAAGAPVKLQYQRGRKRREVEVSLAATSRPLRLAERRAQIGLGIGDPEEGGGAPVRSVTRNSPAEKAGIREGEILLKIDGVPLTTAARLGDSVAQKEPGDTLTLTLRRDGQETDVKVELAEAPGPRTGASPGGERGVFKKDVYRLAVICIEYPDVQHNPQVPAAEWEEALFSAGTYRGKNSATGQPVYGSMRDYFAEQSNGGLRVEGKIFDWLTVSKKRGDYTEGTGTGGRNRTALLSEAIDLLLARDGEQALQGFDGLFFLYAGGRVQTSRGGLYWPHRSTLSHRGERWSYFIVPEGGERISNISVICHEFGHMLGLPDLYARPENPGSEGLGNWCVMSNQVNNGRPQHMGAWCKERLGWLTPTVIDPTVKQKLVLSPINGSRTECFKVLVRPDGSEYLLLENRRRTGFDTSLPEQGLLIWRVVGNRPILEESHGVEGPAGPGVFLTSVPYPSGANNAFTPYTVPSSRSQLGGGLPVYITNIRSLPDGRVSFYVGYEFQ